MLPNHLGGEYISDPTYIFSEFCILMRAQISQEDVKKLTIFIRLLSKVWGYVDSTNHLNNLFWGEILIVWTTLTTYFLFLEHCLHAFLSVMPAINPRLIQQYHGNAYTAQNSQSQVGRRIKARVVWVLLLERQCHLRLCRPFPLWSIWCWQQVKRVILILLIIIIVNAFLLIDAWFAHPELMTQMTLWLSVTKTAIAYNWAWFWSASHLQSNTSCQSLMVHSGISSRSQWHCGHLP